VEVRNSFLRFYPHPYFPPGEIRKGVVIKQEEYNFHCENMKYNIAILKVGFFIFSPQDIQIFH
jgi:hypothetical protein